MDLSPSAEASEGDEAVFDFGGMDGDLELEESFDAAEEAPMDFSPSGGESTEVAADAGGDDLGGGMEFETAMEFETGDFDAGDEASLDLETPMSEFSPEEPPSWMDEGAAAGSREEVLDFSSVSAAADDAVEAEVPLRERRTPRSRPSPPKLRKQRNLALPFVIVVLLLAVGLGGYVAWPIVSDRLATANDPEVPAVVLPPISEELMPVMRDAADAALASIYAAERSEWATAAPRVSEPPSDWLAGIYLATAGDFSSVETFWAGIAEFIDEVRDVDMVAFDAAVRAELDARGIDEADAAAIVARADSGFVAAEPDRAAVYQRFQRLSDAALGLHRFLVANQDNIEYAPAAAVTTDPVLEVDPASEEIANAMNDRLDDYFRAQLDLEVRDRPTAEGLLTGLRDRLQESWIR